MQSPPPSIRPARPSSPPKKADEPPACVAIGKPPRAATPSPVDPVCDHTVQFYEGDDFLAETVASFMAPALVGGAMSVVIATQSHRDAIRSSLELRGLDVTAAQARGEHVSVDAAALLAAFMVDGMPDRTRFEATLGPVLTAATRGGRRVRVFGEMVALLWAEGNSAGALALEELWNEAGERWKFRLLCAYPLASFAHDRQGDAFRHVCRTHGRVLPTESFADDSDEASRLRNIAELQQKALTLDLEIHHRQHAETGASEQKTRLAMAAALAHLGIWELDLVTQSVTCSDQCRVHLDIAARTDITFERVIQSIHPDDREAVRQSLRQAIAGGHEFATEFRVALPGGGVRWLSSLGRSFQNGSHRFLGVTLDITDRKHAAAHLEHTVAERTAELQALIADLEAFSSSISHDMRAPLRNMQGFASVLLKEHGTAFNAEARHYLERIIASGERMDRLIQDVLTFSRVTRGELNLEPVNLDHLVRGILECYPNLQQPHANIVIDGVLPPVIGNAAALTQCFSNLLGNAVKFVPPGTEPQVRVWAEPMPAESAGHADGSAGRMVRVCVHDNGIGIPPDAHERIFGIFQRLGKTYDGTGIGLAIVKRAAERMGGRVGVASLPGTGSTFWLELRAAET